jgi:hypothetical protein
MQEQHDDRLDLVSEMPCKGAQTRSRSFWSLSSKLVMMATLMLLAFVTLIPGSPANAHSSRRDGRGHGWENSSAWRASIDTTDPYPLKAEARVDSRAFYADVHDYEVPIYVGNSLTVQLYGDSGGCDTSTNLLLETLSLTYQGPGTINPGYFAYSGKITDTTSGTLAQLEAQVPLPSWFTIEDPNAPLSGDHVIGCGQFEQGN